MKIQEEKYTMASGGSDSHEEMLVENMKKAGIKKTVIDALIKDARDKSSKEALEQELVKVNEVKRKRYKEAAAGETTSSCPGCGEQGKNRCRI